MTYITEIAALVSQQNLINVVALGIKSENLKQIYNSFHPHLSEYDIGDTTNTLNARYEITKAGDYSILFHNAEHSFVISERGSPPNYHYIIHSADKDSLKSKLDTLLLEIHSPGNQQTEEENNPLTLAGRNRSSRNLFEGLELDTSSPAPANQEDVNNPLLLPRQRSRSTSLHHDDIDSITSILQTTIKNATDEKQLTL